MAEKSKSFVVWVVVLIAAAIGAYAGKGLVRSLTEPSAETKLKAMSQGLEEAAKRINAKGPQMLDEFTRIDRASISKVGEITYHHTLVKHSSRDIGSVDLYTKLRPEVVKKLCGSADMQKALDLGAVFAYEYTGNDGLVIETLRVKKLDCKR